MHHFSARRVDGRDERDPGPVGAGRGGLLIAKNRQVLTGVLRESSGLNALSGLNRTPGSGRCTRPPGKITTGRSGVPMTVRLVVTAFISLAVAAPVTHRMTLGGDGEHAQTVCLGSDGRRGADAGR